MASSRPRGFTLVEVTVSLLFVGLMTTAAVVLLQQQRRALTTTSGDRAMQETIRTALDEMGANLRRAGFGVEPWLAFDFGSVTAPPAPAAIAGYQCTTAVTCRDSATASDELVFHARDPSFKARLAAAPAATTLTIVGGLQNPLFKGQILQVMCAAGAARAYVTVGAKVNANWVPPAAAPASTAITLLGDAAAFPRQNAALLAGCFANGWANARVYRVERFRYHVARFAEVGFGGAGRPYLMLDRGLTDDDDGSRAEPIVPDVEDLQVEYVFVHPTTGAARVIGATPGVALASSAASVDLAAAPPDYDTPTDGPARLTNHPANVRAVRVSVVARLPAADLTRTGSSAQLVTSQGAFLPPAGNRPVAGADVGYFRMRVETTEATRNVEARAPYFDE